MQTDDSNIIEVKRWKEVGSAVLGSMRSSTAPLSSKCTNSLIEELKPDIDIYLELDMRGRQGRAYVVDACTIIAAPLTITKFYAQNEIMWECGVFDMLAADTTGALCVLFLFVYKVVFGLCLVPFLSRYHFCAFPLSFVCFFV